jgi:hypothetical protein
VNYLFRELFWNGKSGLNQSKVDETLAMYGPKECVKSLRFMKSDLDHIGHLQENVVGKVS